MKQPDLSVVIPVFNEEDNLEPLLKELEGVLAGLGRSYEVLCIDDCSTDRSLEVLKQLKATRPWLRILRHGVNSGESAAEATGFEHANGDIIITMDADQQNDPHDIPALLDSLKDDIVAVCGVRRKREDDWVKRLSSRTANVFRNWATGDRISDAGCTFRALRRHALREVLVFNGMHRFLPTMLRLQGYKVVEILVNHRPRVKGLSKYGVGNRVWRGLVDCFAMRWYRRRCVRGARFESEL
ncbi:MAG: Undecaprenyl-phosphate 4-deoxy-4-formamido-L-arabinose transferase [Verrucomicrobia bacterium ADurb.Bin345]|nr:MAG: Undecaprenyl-phosphate 4-deoxy-4-formamido-L-arabinose transferase [Verrucomicrobia bacterium ADurb.Bin345]